MNRNLRAKRLWSMGSFNNVELQDEITDIPENVALNPKAVGLLYNLMIMEMESAYVNYLAIYKEHPVMIKAFPAIIDFFQEMNLAVEQEKTKTFNQLMEELNKEIQKQQPKIVPLNKE
jgi:hypothetical protein